LIRRHATRPVTLGSPNGTPTGNAALAALPAWPTNSITFGRSGKATRPPPLRASRPQGHPKRPPRQWRDTSAAATMVAVIRRERGRSMKRYLGLPPERRLWRLRRYLGDHRLRYWGRPRWHLRRYLGDHRLRYPVAVSRRVFRTFLVRRIKPPPERLCSYRTSTLQRQRRASRRLFPSRCRRALVARKAAACRGHRATSTPAITSFSTSATLRQALEARWWHRMGRLPLR
jgi:hypothetical protein